MKVIFRNSTLEFKSKIPVKVVDLVGGYANKKTFPWGTDWAVVIDYVTGVQGDNANQQCLFSTSILGDISHIILTKSKNIVIKNSSIITAKESLAYTRYKVAIHSSGAIFVLNDATINNYSVTPGISTDIDIMVGCRRQTKTQPFLGKYVGIYIANNMPVENFEAFFNNPMTYATNVYLPENIQGLTWRDSVGNADLTLSNEAIVDEL